MKKITAAVLAFSIIALLGVSLIAAFPMGFGKGMNQDLSEEEQAEAQAFHDSLQQAIEDKDFNSWRNLMISQLTEENFNMMAERHNNMQNSGQGMKKGLGKGMGSGQGMNGKCPFAEASLE
jgi:hypothetical protein